MGSRINVTMNGLTVGGSAPVRVESMLKTPLTDIQGCAEELAALAKAGCELARVALPEISLSENLRELTRLSAVPLMADIHFSHSLGMAALHSGCSSIRINPSNMRERAGLEELLELAKEKNAVIRIGANSGSLNNSQIAMSGGDRAAALVSAVEEQLDVLQSRDFHKIIISAKSSSVPETVRANSILSQRYDFPLHIGITEAGSGMQGIIKGAAGISMMLSQGTGDTLRVSLTAPGTEEVEAGYHILRALGIRKRGVEIISCPTCGRRRIDVASLAETVRQLIPAQVKGNMTIAVMGCEVNGPREAAGADIGVAGTAEGFVLFKKGIPCCTGKIETLSEKLKKTFEDFF